MGKEFSTSLNERIFSASGDSFVDSLSNGENIYTNISGVTVPVFRKNIGNTKRIFSMKAGFEGTTFEDYSGKNIFTRMLIPDVNVRRMRIWFRHYGLVNNALITGLIIRPVADASLSTGGTWQEVDVGSGITVPIANVSTYQTTHLFPGEACSDWFELDSSFDRTDGGYGKVFDVVARCDSTYGIKGSVVSYGDVVGWSNSTTDWVTTKPASISKSNFSSTVAWIEVEEEVALSIPKKTVAMCGDSIFSGVGSSINTMSCIQNGVTGSGLFGAYISVGGSTARTSHENLSRFIPFINVDYIIIQMWSINDVLKTNGQSVSDAVSDSLLFRDKLSKMGYNVFICGAFPCNVSESVVRSCRDLMVEKKIDFFDPCLVACDDPDSSAVWKSGYYADDFHPNDTGISAIGASLTSWLNARLNP